MSASIAVICFVAIAWAIWPLSVVRFLVAIAVVMVGITYIQPAKAGGLPGRQMSALHYEKFRDTFMTAKCVEIGLASSEDFSRAYTLLIQRDPMAAKAVEAGGNTLGLYLGDTYSRDLSNVIRALDYMQGDMLKTYCQFTVMRATTR